MGLPNLNRARESKARIIRGERLDSNSELTRPYYCRSCGVERQGVAIPRGWYALSRHTGTWQQKTHRLGVFCSLDCLQQDLPRLDAIAADLGDAWEAATAWARQR